VQASWVSVGCGLEMIANCCTPPWGSGSARRVVVAGGEGKYSR
jgi:hypothetical protein